MCEIKICFCKGSLKISNKGFQVYQFYLASEIDFPLRGRVSNEASLTFIRGGNSKGEAFHFFEASSSLINNFSCICIMNTAFNIIG